MRMPHVEATPPPGLQVLSVLCAMLAGCTGSAAQAPPTGPPTTIQSVWGSYNAGVTSSMVLASVFDPPPTTAVVVDVEGSATQVTCQAGKRLCIETIPELSTWYDGAAPSPWDNPLPQPEGRAEVVAGKLQVTWKLVPGAAIYAVTYREIALSPPGSLPSVRRGPVFTSELQASFDLPGGTPPLAVVELEAWATDPFVPFTKPQLLASDASRSMRAIPVIGAGWSLQQPSDFTPVPVGGDAALTLAVPEGNRLAVILVNLGGLENAAVSVQAAGTVAASGGALRASVRAAPVLEAGPVASPPDQGLLGLSPQAALAAPTLATPAEAHRSFCTFVSPPTERNTGEWVNTRRPATLMLETGRVLLYVDDEDVPGFTAAELEELAAWWEVIEPISAAHSGPPTDVDGNGKYILFFTGRLGPFIRGVANAGDAWYDPSDLACASNMQSNAADMIHVHPLLGMTDESHRAIPRDVAMEVAKGAMAYTLQRMVDRFGCARCIEVGNTKPVCDSCMRDFEVQYAHMGLAATLAGSGNHVASLRALAAPALFTRQGPGPGFGGYPSLRMSPYELTPVNRAAVDSFILYFADRLGSDFIMTYLERGATARQFELISGVPLPIAYALWTGALLFSNEPASPWEGFDYTGTASMPPPFEKAYTPEQRWVPLHEKFQRFEYAPLEAGPRVDLTLRATGFDTYVTGVAGPGGGTVTVTSHVAVNPYVVAIPFQGPLP